MQFRKKPVVIEAIPASTILDAKVYQYGDLPAWVRDSAIVVTTDGNLKIPTLEGEMTAGPSDWIIRGVQGELYPCKPDIFDATYEAVES